MANEELKEKINNLTNSDIIQNDRLDELEDRLGHLDKLLEGDPDDKNDNGLKGDLKELSVGLNALRTIMAPDHLGQGGVNNRLRNAEDEIASLKKADDNKWKFRTAVAVAFIGTVATVVTNLDKIEKFFEPRSSIQPAPKKRRVVKRVIRIAPEDLAPPTP